MRNIRKDKDVRLVAVLTLFHVILGFILGATRFIGYLVEIIARTNLNAYCLTIMRVGIAIYLSVAACLVTGLVVVLLNSIHKNRIPLSNR